MTPRAVRAPSCAAAMTRLGAVRLTGNAVQLFEDDGSLLIELPLDSAATRGQLRDQLSGAVKILT